MYSTRTLHQLICPFEDLITKVYGFANADIEEKAELYIRHTEFRPFYIFLIRKNERFNEGVLALFNTLPAHIRKDMIKELDPSEVALLVDSIPNELERKDIIDSASTCPWKCPNNFEQVKITKTSLCGSYCTESLNNSPSSHVLEAAPFLHMITAIH
jgi:hypothetical protein